MADIRYLITVDSATAQAQIRQFDGDIDKLGKTSAGTESKFGGLWRQVATGQLVYDAVKRAGSAFIDLLNSSTKAAIEAEKADHDLNAALDITGRTVPGLSDHFKNYALALMKSTTFSDESIKSAQALLIQMTHLDRDGIDKATRGAIGLASALGMDLQSAAQLVQKAMEGNTAALSRYGIRVDENLGSEEKQAAILNKLNQLYRRAEADVGTTAGKIAQMKNRVDEAKEAFGGSIVNVEAYQNVIKNTGKFAEDMATAMTNLAKAIKDVNAPINLLLDITTTRLHPAFLSINQEMRKLIGAADDSRRPTATLTALWDIISKTWKVAGEHGYDVAAAIKALEDQAAKNAGLEKLRDIAKDLGIKLKTDTIAQVQKLEDNLKKLRLTGELTTGAAAKLRDEIAKLRYELSGLSAEIVNTFIPSARNVQAIFERMGATIGTTATPAMRQLSAAMTGYINQINSTWNSGARNMAQVWSERLHNIAVVGGAVANGLDAIFAQSAQNRMTAIDNEYQRRRQYIISHITDETAQNAALEQLDTQMAGRRRTIMRDYARAQKAVSLVNAIVSTAEGVAKALATPPPMSFILAAITAGLGAVQIGLIASQPLPLARGAIFTQRTRLMSERGGYYEVGEGGQPEVLAPLSDLPAVARAAGAGARGGRRGQPLHIHTHFILDGREIKEKILKVVMEADSIGALKLKKAIT